MISIQVRADTSDIVLVPLLAGMLAVLTVLGTVPVKAQETDISSSRTGMSSSEAVIEQVGAPERSTTIANATKVSVEPFLQTVLGQLQGVGPGVTALSESAPQHLNRQEVVVRQDGSGNIATVDQRNASNVAAILQRGNFNETRVRQRGRANAVGIVIDGNNNSLDVLQKGSRNRYLLGFRGDNLGRPGTRTVSQKGSNNLLVELGQTRMPFSVQQKGNGMRMMIRHSGGR